MQSLLRKGRALTCAVSTTALALVVPWVPLTGDREPLSFNRDVRPILSNNCFRCHGPDPSTREAKLRLDTQQGLYADLDGIPLVAPGDPEESELYLRIASEDAEDRMPHPDSGLTLTEEQISTIARWIREGAVYEGHWAYQSPRPVDPPEVGDAKWSRSPVDPFVLRALEQRAWGASPDADPRSLVRRLYQDLTGLPPTAAEVAAFSAQPLELALESTVDRLLASPHYAERMAVHWLDLVRYADTVGYHGDQDRSMSPFRDYVIQAFADNMAYDRFVIEQLAGDLLPEATLEQQIASGFNRLNQITAEGGAQEKEYLAIYAADRVRTTATVFLGSTLGCAQCHDHKFDPFTTKDFYSFGAFFADLEERGVYNGANQDGNWGPRVEVPTAEEQALIQEQEMQLASLHQALDTNTPQIEALQLSWEEELRRRLPAQPEDFDWIDDAQENGGTTSGSWTFVGSDQVEALSGAKARRQEGSEIVQHFFHDADRRVRIGAQDRFFTHVWIDPESPPDTLMLQIHAGATWEHRAYWGADKINFGGIGRKGPGHRHQGPLPAAGQWVRLEVDAATLGLVPGEEVDGMAFTQFGGRAYWDRSGLHAQNPLHSIEGIDSGIQQALVLAPEERTTEQRQELSVLHRRLCPELADTRAELATTEARLKQARQGVTTSLVSRAIEARVMRVLPRGNWMDESGEVVLPAVPRFLAQIPGSSSQPLAEDGSRLDRLDLARWLVDPQNPLTARVFVNRIWALYFGRGIVRSLGDFGAQGEWPDHQELLDWLALDFVASGWDVKHLVRRIVTSRTYRQASAGSGPLWNRDPENRALGRQQPYRIDAEFVRDHALAVSGLLNRSVGGRSAKPYQPAGFWRELNFPVRQWKHDPSVAGLRRGLYTYWCRTFLHPSLAAFDAVSREECAVERTRSNTPQQALVLLNDPTYVEAARALALRILAQAPSDPLGRIRFAFQTTLQRDPRGDEIQVMLGFLEAQRSRIEATPSSSTGLLTVGDHARVDAQDSDEVVLWTETARVLLNLHEFITRS